MKQKNTGSVIQQMSEIAVAEMFYTVQGEGPYVGTPAIFLRLAGCNLSCGATETDLKNVDSEHTPDEDATWYCDTIEVWREADFVYSPTELYNEWQERGWIENLSSRTHIVLTGGEPTLPKHQEAFFEFYQQIKEENPFVEVETNGTILPSDFDSCVNHYNISLKLSNSGHTAKERINDEVVEEYVDKGSEDAVFKFVVSSNEDISEVEKIVSEFNIPNSQISLMPAGQTQNQLSETYPKVVEICKEKKWRFSPRMHITIWNQKTGV